MPKVKVDARGTLHEARGTLHEARGTLKTTTKVLLLESVYGTMIENWWWSN